MRPVTTGDMSSHADRGLLALDAIEGARSDLVGRKAAALARAHAAGLPVLPGVVVTSALSAGLTEEDAAELIARVARFPSPWIIRSSAVDEDAEDGSRAGQYLSVRDVGTDTDLVDAVRAVADSAAGAPIAVLIQPQVGFAVSGVLFGVDPVSGEPGMVVAATAGSPERLVSGTESGERLELSRRGVLTRAGRRLRGSAGLAGVPGVRAREVGRALAQLAARAAEVFGGPQDIEWGWTGAGTLWMLQSRPVTRVAARVPPGAALLGTGPLAETFPGTLWPLEVDTWLPPLETGLAAALRASGSGSPLPDEPVVRAVNGRLVADLKFFGRRARSSPLNVLRGLRRLRVAWRLGRLRAALRGTTATLIRDVDRLLLEVPAPQKLTDGQLVGLVDRAGQALAVVHEYEALVGLVAAPTAEPISAAGVALGVLSDEGVPAGELIEREPVLLALVPPSIAAPLWPSQPNQPSRPNQPRPSQRPAKGLTVREVGAPVPEPSPGILREAMRLRARWLQELQVVAWRTLGERLAEAGRLPNPLAIRQLTRVEVDELLRDPAARFDDRPDRAPDPTPLPVRFRLAEDGTVAAEPVADDGANRGFRGTGASAGRATGVAVHDPRDLDGGGDQILVTEALEPSLAVHLPGLAALVSEVGSPLSHLAILAREHAVPCVVALPAARRRLRPGQFVVVDGRTGTVEIAPHVDDREEER